MASKCLKLPGPKSCLPIYLTIRCVSVRSRPFFIRWGLGAANVLTLNRARACPSLYAYMPRESYRPSTDPTDYYCSLR